MLFFWEISVADHEDKPVLCPGHGHIKEPGFLFQGVSGALYMALDGYVEGNALQQVDEDDLIKFQPLAGVDGGRVKLLTARFLPAQGSKVLNALGKGMNVPISGGQGTGACPPYTSWSHTGFPTG